MSDNERKARARWGPWREIIQRVAHANHGITRAPKQGFGDLLVMPFRFARQTPQQTSPNGYIEATGSSVIVDSFRVDHLAICNYSGVDLNLFDLKVGTNSMLTSSTKTAIFAGHTFLLSPRWVCPAGKQVRVILEPRDETDPEAHEWLSIVAHVRFAHHPTRLICDNCYSTDLTRGNGERDRGYYLYCRKCGHVQEVVTG